MTKPEAVLDSLAAALREAEDSLSRARFQVEQARNGTESIIPALVRDLINDTTGWCSHASSWTRTLDELERMPVEGR